MIYVTVHPDWMAAPVLQTADLVAALGEAPHETLQAVASSVGSEPPESAPAQLEPGQALLWRPAGGTPAQRFRIAQSRGERRRHRRKYAEGELPPERSFYFRGPQKRLNLRAQNLILFLQLAEGVDDETWLHHLRAHDYSTWMRDFIKDPTLGEEVAAIERDAALTPQESRQCVRAAVEAHYTLPAAGEGAG
jgi:hypothetical protein